MLHAWREHPALRLALVLALVVFISACGFRLRGYIQLPAEFQPLHIQASGPARNLSQTLTRQLEQSGIELTSSTAQARLRLELSNLESSERQVIFGVVEEYEMELSVKATARDAEGEPLFTDEEFRAQRQYSYDSDNDTLLARDSLRRELREAMESDLIRQLTLRIQALEERHESNP
ncbi:Lipopolysaccharide-assembly [Marinospirillum celere]|uniref:LPS-assembly lipoprotein LptE n=1 Tax=Marinospirillum celere TaxID=1122252 RepID=A0A1I1DUH0_9GAMM|nr:LPS assembly lipoprotein LptE [Marinospirillum celere]SFB78062.1 Lipopolysaccharide-assembly [Marinospirillum celere]